MGLNDIKIKYQSFSIFEKIILYNALIFLFSIFGIFSSKIEIFLDFFELNSNIVNLLLYPWTLITYSLIHGSLLHLFSNMLVLFYVSNTLVNVFKDSLPVKIYLYGILTGGLFFVLYCSIKGIDSPSFNLVGASAGVRALLIFLCLYMPNKKIGFGLLQKSFPNYFISDTFTLIFSFVFLCFVFLFSLPTYLLLILFILFSYKFIFLAYFICFCDILNVLLFGDNIGGHIAHIGGDLLGLYFYSNLYSNKNSSFFNLEYIKSFFFKKSSMKYYKNNNSKKSRLKNDTATQKRIDIILEKISKSGYENLSKDEKEFLFKVGKK